MGDYQINKYYLTSSNLKRGAWPIYNDTIVALNFYFMNYDEDNVCFFGIKKCI